MAYASPAAGSTEPLQPPSPAAAAAASAAATAAAAAAEVAGPDSEAEAPSLRAAGSDEDSQRSDAMAAAAAFRTPGSDEDPPALVDPLVLKVGWLENSFRMFMAQQSWTPNHPKSKPGRREREERRAATRSADRKAKGGKAAPLPQQHQPTRSSSSARAAKAAAAPPTSPGGNSDGSWCEIEVPTGAATAGTASAPAACSSIPAAAAVHHGASNPPAAEFEQEPEGAQTVARFKCMAEQLCEVADADPRLVRTLYDIVVKLVAKHGIAAEAAGMPEKAGDFASDILQQRMAALEAAQREQHQCLETGLAEAYARISALEAHQAAAPGEAPVVGGVSEQTAVENLAAVATADQESEGRLQMPTGEVRAAQEETASEDAATAAAPSSQQAAAPEEAPVVGGVSEQTAVENLAAAATADQEREGSLQMPTGEVGAAQEETASEDAATAAAPSSQQAAAPEEAPVVGGVSEQTAVENLAAAATADQEREGSLQMPTGEVGAAQEETASEDAATAAAPSSQQAEVVQQQREASLSDFWAAASREHHHSDEATAAQALQRQEDEASEAARREEETRAAREAEVLRQQRESLRNFLAAAGRVSAHIDSFRRELQDDKTVGNINMALMDELEHLHHSTLRALISRGGSYNSRAAGPIDLAETFAGEVRVSGQDVLGAFSSLVDSIGTELRELLPGDLRMQLDEDLQIALSQSTAVFTQGGPVYSMLGRALHWPGGSGSQQFALRRAKATLSDQRQGTQEALREAADMLCSTPTLLLQSLQGKMQMRMLGAGRPYPAQAPRA